jgi:hypothetical protein
MELYAENTGTMCDQNHKDLLKQVQLLHLDLSPDLSRYPDFSWKRKIQMIVGKSYCCKDLHGLVTDPQYLLGNLHE